MTPTQKSILQSFVLSTAITSILVLASFLLSVDINWFETAAVFFSFACTWLCVKQVRFNYILGIVSTILLSYVFFKTGLYGSMALNLYLIPTVIYGWFIWGKDTATKPVEHVKPKSAIYYALFTALTYFGALGLITLLGGHMAALDGWLLIGSILAQFLLDRKKIETWIVWVLVNIVSVYVYFQAGLYLLVFQFALFLINAIYAYFQWKKDLVTDDAQRSNLDDSLVADDGTPGLSPVRA